MTGQLFPQQEYDNILNLIMTKKLIPGQVINSEQLALDYGVDEFSIDGALEKLAYDGFVTIDNSSISVAVYDIKKIINVIAMRISFECLAVKLALENPCCTDFIKLKRIAKNCKGAFADGDLKQSRIFNFDFHEELVRLGRNDILTEFHRRIILQTKFIVLYYHELLNLSPKSHDHHIQISDALILKDIKLAVTLTAKHIRDMYNITDELPENFEQDIFLHG